MKKYHFLFRQRLHVLVDRIVILYDDLIFLKVSPYLIIQNLIIYIPVAFLPGHQQERKYHRNMVDIISTDV